jgi:hypothetical protein
MQARTGVRLHEGGNVNEVPLFEIICAVAGTTPAMEVVRRLRENKLVIGSADGKLVVKRIQS